MSERTPEDKKNDLENALLQAKRKDIDGIPWYQSEAMADEIERLRDVLANEVKHHVAKIDRIKELEHSAAWETPACATYRIRAEAAESQVAALTASLAELRKRMGEAEKVIGLARSLANMLPNDYNTGKWTKAELEKVFTDFLASPPSPAPVEKMPVATDTECLDWLDRHCSFVADAEYKIGPYKIGELRKMAYEGILTDILRGAPVESKPCECENEADLSDRPGAYIAGCPNHDPAAQPAQKQGEDRE